MNINPKVDLTLEYNKGFRLNGLLFAVFLIGIIIGFEYVFRHYFVLWIPRIGELKVNDLIALGLCYVLLAGTTGVFFRIKLDETFREIRRRTYDLLMTWKYIGWVVILGISFWTLPLIDRALWGNLHIPLWLSSYRNPVHLLPGSGPVLKIIFLISINGLLVPIAEEFLWRGLIQPRLVRNVGIIAGIGITALVFSLKHVIIDASMNRFLSVVVFGVVLGYLAHREDWHTSAALHLFINSISSVTILLLGKY